MPANAQKSRSIWNIRGMHNFGAVLQNQGKEVCVKVPPDRRDHLLVRDSVLGDLLHPPESPGRLLEADRNQAPLPLGRRIHRRVRVLA
eukprot:953132-Pyramimonas_sp.AAC.1